MLWTVFPEHHKVAVLADKKSRDPQKRLACVAIVQNKKHQQHML